MSKYPGYRHLYTVAERGSLGAPGFQSIACSAEIEESVRELEEIVGGFRSSDPDGDRQSRQVVQMYDPDFYALTTFTPLAPSPASRSGNYWAETFVIPAVWLGQGDWDLGAAFESLPWRGPEDPKTFGDWPHALGAPELLPPLSSRPREGLESLREMVAEPVLFELVLAVAQLTQTRRTIQVIERGEAVLEHAPYLGLLLPLVLPPVVRKFVDGKRERTFQVRTWSRPGKGPKVDIETVSADDAHPSPPPDVRVLDPRGSVADRGADRQGYAYAAYAARLIAAGDWESLLSLYAQVDPSLSARRFLQDFRPPAPAASAPDPAVHPTPVPPRAAAVPKEKREEWLTREQLDKVLAEHGQRVRHELDETIMAMALMSQKSAELIEEQRREYEKNLREELSNYQNQLSTILRDGTVDLRRTLGEAGGLEQLVGQLKLASQRFHQDFDTQRRELARLENNIRSLRNGFRDERELWSQEVTRLDDRLRQWEGERQTALAELPRDSSGDKLTPEKPNVYATAGSAPIVKDRSPNRVRGWLKNLSPKRRAVILLIPILVAVAVGGIIWWRTNSIGESPIETEEPADQPGTEELEESIRQRLLESKILTSLFEQAATDPASSEEATALFLDLIMDQEAAPAEIVRKALGQEALGITVDGQFGSGSARSLQEAIKSYPCCTELSGDPPVTQSPQFNCYLGNTLGFDSESACEGGDLLAGKVMWGADESQKLLELIKRARASALETNSNEELDQSFRDSAEKAAEELSLYDLQAQEEATLRQRVGSIKPQQIDGDELDRLLRLAWSKTNATGRQSAPGKLRMSDLEKIEDWIERAEATPEPIAVDPEAEPAS